MIVYLSHSLGEGNGHESVRRHDNISNALNWYKFGTEYLGWTIVMPWLPAVIANLHGSMLSLTFAHQMLVLDRCPAIAHVGGAFSAHMRDERARAIRNSIATVDLTDLGREPPDPIALTLTLIHKRMDAALVTAGKLQERSFVRRAPRPAPPRDDDDDPGKR